MSDRLESLEDAVRSADALDALMRVGKARGVTDADRDRILLATAMRRYAKALVDYMDGEKDHDIASNTGLSQDDCEEIAAARAEAQALVYGPNVLWMAE